MSFRQASSCCGNWAFTPLGVNHNEVTHVTHFQPSTATTVLGAAGIFDTTQPAKLDTVYHLKIEEPEDVIRQRIVRISQRSGVAHIVKSRILDPLGIVDLNMASRELLSAVEQMLHVLTLYKTPET